MNRWEADGLLISGYRQPHSGDWVVARFWPAYGNGMEARGISEALKLIIEQRGGSQGDLGRELGVTQKWVSNVILGKRDPGITRTAGYLARVGWEVRISPKRRQGDPMKRRDFLAGVASVTFIPSSKTGPYQDPEYVRNLSARMTNTLYELGGVSIVTAALRHISCIKPALNSGDRQLQSAASELARQGMLVLYDAQRLSDAEYAGGLALDLAQRAKDYSGQIDAYRELSMISAFRGNGNRAATYAQFALQLPESTSKQHAFSLMQFGRALGLLDGSKKKARRKLDEALEIDGLSAFEKADLMGGVGVALKEQKEFGKAHEVLDDAVRRLEPMSPMLQANYQARQIQAALSVGDPSLTAELIRSLANTAPLVTSARLDGYVTQIIAASSQWADVAEIHDAREQLKAVMPGVSRRTLP